jgi:hypothetical protein
VAAPESEPDRSDQQRHDDERRTENEVPLASADLNDLLEIRFDGARWLGFAHLTNLTTARAMAIPRRRGSIAFTREVIEFREHLAVHSGNS